MPHNLYDQFRISEREMMWRSADGGPYQATLRTPNGDKAIGEFTPADFHSPASRNLDRDHWLYWLVEPATDGPLQDVPRYQFKLAARDWTGFAARPAVTALMWRDQLDRFATMQRADQSLAFLHSDESYARQQWPEIQRDLFNQRIRIERDWSQQLCQLLAHQISQIEQDVGRDGQSLALTQPQGLHRDLEDFLRNFAPCEPAGRQQFFQLIRADLVAFFDHAGALTADERVHRLVDGEVVSQPATPRQPVVLSYDADTRSDLPSFALSDNDEPAPLPPGIMPDAYSARQPRLAAA